MTTQSHDRRTYQRYATFVLTLGTMVLSLLAWVGVPTGVFWIIFLQIFGLLETIH